jgi:hypothetical protein
LDKRYSIDVNNETNLGKWLERQKGMGNEEKCGIKLDYKLIISVLRRQS